MGLIIKKEDSNAIIAVWKTTESLTSLEKSLKHISIPNIHNQKRRKEIFSVRLLLKHLGINDAITYKKGAPEIESRRHISISHCADLSAIIIGKKRNGIDIQEVSKKSLRISSKFINQHIQNLTKEKCTLIWAIKEAVFKWHRKGSVDFKKDIQVPDFNIAEKGKIDVNFKGEELIARYLKIENQFLVYVCK